MTFEDLSPQQLLSALAAYLEDEISGATPIGAVLKFEYPDGGCLVIDGTGNANRISLENEEADCVVSLPLETHAQMLRFELDQTTAFREGRMRIKGNIAVAIKLGPLVSTAFRVPGEGA
ncbi:SCP2 sterol-binding domain-containing protein [Parvibaculaceae bacterium PLY_AMNH_Bact1]|nr:SCP2 sterol-binding domain-containing protein [Parvibaculaceae bacterium PLY_AMNH_Bact1]